MIFEPTGDLVKDYCAFCEIDQLNERDDILDGIISGEKETVIRIRNTQYCLNKRDAGPLCNAIPHCSQLTSIELTGAGLTEHSQKLIAEAVYKSPSIQTVVVDFNPDGLFKDPTTQKKDKNEVIVFSNQFRGAHLKVAEPAEAKDDPKKKPDPKKSVALKERDETEKTAIYLPTGWHSFLFSGIQVLSLRGNGIGDTVAESIAIQLESNLDLVSLNLWGNEISSNGANCLSKALRTNRRLTCLDLGHNKIDDNGVIALLQCFLTMDLVNDEVLRLRQRTIGGTHSELPIYPTYQDLVAPLLQPADEKKDPKKKDPPKKKGSEGPVERLKGEFDKDCIRLDDHRVRCPGNTSLWCLNLAQNPLLSSQVVGVIQGLFSRREPSVEEIFNDGNVREPAPYVCSLQLRHLIIESTSLDHRHQESVNAAVLKAVPVSTV
eukprot:CAMPEP_0176410370 /NCGR_PEP_ID=MMETSP0127-20121128/3019_1 /TAXON_ID=938130 /ORGANISM="Platyophrya macrostoma, Strain WH" /LENGTH=433 /DNA_ID=CAMNT_0017789859 /DNA_START=36 /DNA_END=1337 /DNA_ORIENTATION=+